MYFYSGSDDYTVCNVRGVACDVKRSIIHQKVNFTCQHNASLSLEMNLSKAKVGEMSEKKNLKFSYRTNFSFIYIPLPLITSALISQIYLMNRVP